MHRSGQEPILTIGNDFGDLPIGHQRNQKRGQHLGEHGDVRNGNADPARGQEGTPGPGDLLPRPSQQQACFSFFGLRSSYSFIFTQNGSRGSWPSPGRDALEEQAGRSQGWRGCAQCGVRRGGRGTAGNPIPGAPLFNKRKLACSSPRTDSPQGGARVGYTGIR